MSENSTASLWGAPADLNVTADASRPNEARRAHDRFIRVVDYLLAVFLIAVGGLGLLLWHIAGVVGWI